MTLFSEPRGNYRPHLYILRGLPGSGKSRIAKKIREKYGGVGVVLSTDDYFKNKDGTMNFDKALLGSAHDENRRKAYEAMKGGHNPVIIDNTNIHLCEMRAYVKMGLRFHYHIRFRFARNSWRLSVHQLCQRTSWTVDLRVIQRMKRDYEYVKDIWDVLRDNRYRYNYY